jgi:hypothetical protein
VVHLFILLLGLWLLFVILRSMIRIALMNRHYQDFFAEVTGRAVYSAVSLRLRGKRDAGAIHTVLLWFFPAYVLSLIAVYFAGAMTAFMLLYWGTSAVNDWRQAFIASGSALNTLGFATPTTVVGQWLAIPEGALGLGIVVFLFTFIPSYQAAIRLREDKAYWLYVRVGDQPNGVIFLEWCKRAGMGSNMGVVWEAWEGWFRMLGDTHSILPMLALSPSVQSGQSWVVASAAALDAAALTVSCIDTGDAEAAEICLRAGTSALCAIADALGRASTAPQQANALPSRATYEAVWARLCSAGLPLRQSVDHEIQWKEFLTLRQLYQGALFSLARQTFVPLGGVQFDAGEPALPARNRAYTSTASC